MALTAAMRTNLLRSWRGLAESCLAGTVTADWSYAADWVSPFEDAADSYALFALGRLAKSAFKAKRNAAHQLRRPALTALAMLALELLPDPPTPPPPPQLPFRADLDG